MTLERLVRLGARCLTYDTIADQRGVLYVAPAGHPLITPIAMIRSFYVLAEAVARARGSDPDSPPHLSKVTQTL
jgi:glucosamine--fructose-6-phosphate aminotransferase (isomerizing)